MPAVLNIRNNPDIKREVMNQSFLIILYPLNQIFFISGSNKQQGNSHGIIIVIILQSNAIFTHPVNSIVKFAGVGLIH
jgi:hypothetical protein